MTKAKFSPIFCVLLGALLVFCCVGGFQFSCSNEQKASADTNEYSIVFDLTDWENIKTITRVDGATMASAQTISYTYTDGEASQKVYLYNLTKDGYEFNGWLASTFERAKYDADNGFYYIDSVSKKDFYLYADFEAIKYNVVYKNMDGATNPNPNYYTIDNGLVLQSAQKTGYNFLGWFTDPDFMYPIESITKGTMNEVVLYAKFEIKSCTLSFTYGGFSDIVLNYGDKITAQMLPTPTREGYVFEGWYTSAGYVLSVVEGDTITDDLNLFAKWTKLENPIWKPLTFGGMALVVVLTIVWLVAFIKNKKDVE